MAGTAAAGRFATGAAEERRRAIGLFGVSAAHGVNHMYATLLPLIYPILKDQFHFSYGTLGIVIAVSNLAGGVLQAVFGFVNRRISARVLLGWENVILSALVVCMAAITSVTQFAFIRFAGSVAGSPQHPVGSAYCTEEYPAERRGFALASHVGGGNIGTMLVPLLGALCISWFGWRTTLLIFSVPIGVMGVATFFLLRPDAELQARRPEQTDAGWKAELGGMLSRRTVVLILIAATIAAGGRGLGVITTYLPAYLKDGLHLGTITSGVLFNILLIGSVASTVVAGYLSDRFGRKPVLIVSYSLALIGAILLVLTGGRLLLLFPVLLFFGLTAYAETSVLQGFFADAIGEHSHRIGFGLFFTIGYGVGALWAAAIGGIIDQWGFHAAFLVMGASYIAAALVLIPTRDLTWKRGTAATV
ncbi:MAG: MFS transporter [Dehalococcoidia bacterium]